MVNITLVNMIKSHATLDKLELEITSILAQQTGQHKSRTVDNHRVSICLGKNKFNMFSYSRRNGKNSTLTSGNLC